MPIYTKYSGNSSNTAVYPDLASFPATAANGTLAVDGSTNILYEYSTTAVAWQPIASNASYNATTSGVTTVGAIDSQPKVANAASISVGSIYFQTADATHPGMMSTGSQTIAGAKILNSTLLVGGGTTIAPYHANTVAAFVSGPGNAATDISIASYGGVGVAGSPVIRLYGAGGTEGSPEATTNGANIGTMSGQGYDGTALSSGSRASIQFAAAEGWSAIANGSKMTFFTTPIGSTTDTARMIIDGSGNTNVLFNLAVTGTASASNLSGTNTGDVTLTAVGAAPSANGATLSGQALTLQPADATHPGVVTTGAQTIAGAKTFSSTIVGDISGNAATVTTNANLTGVITSVGNATSIAAQTGTGSTFVVQTSPTLTTPNIGAASGSSLSVSGQLTSTVATGTAPLVVSSTTRVSNLNVATAGTADTVTTNANLTGVITSVGNATSIASQTGTGTKFVVDTSPTLVTPVIGAATGTSLSVSGQLTSTIATGTAPLVVSSTTRVANLNVATAGNSDTVTTNANLTGPITSVGNATSIASQTGTGNTFVMNTSPTLVTPVLGAASGTSLSLSGQLTSTLATGTAPLVIASTTRVSNLNVATAGNADTVTTNANLTGVITSVGNATSIASQTGTGTKFVVDTSPTLVTPVLGVATASSINKVAITAPATSATLTIADGKTLVASNSLTLAGTDSTVMTFPTTSATIARTDSAQTFSGNQTFSGSQVSITGTLLQGGATTIAPYSAATTAAFVSTGAGTTATIAAYGGSGVDGAPALRMYSARNTEGTPQASGSGASLGKVTGNGYTGSAFGSKVEIDFSATEAWSGTNNGTKIEFRTTPNGSTTSAVVALLDQTGYLTVGASNNIVGSDGTADAATGNIGQYISSSVSTPTNVPGATTAWGDMTSISLTAGDWDVTGIADYTANGSTMSAGLYTGISTTSGNSATGLNIGDNEVCIPVASAAAPNRTATIAAVRMRITSTTTVYLKENATYVTATPQYTCRLSARRVR